MTRLRSVVIVFWIFLFTIAVVAQEESESPIILAALAQ